MNGLPSGAYDPVTGILQVNLKNGSGEAPTMRVSPGLVGYSTDTKPTDVDKGESFFELDTSAVYIYDGSQWVVI